MRVCERMAFYVVLAHRRKRGAAGVHRHRSDETRGPRGAGQVCLRGRGLRPVLAFAAFLFFLHCVAARAHAQIIGGRGYAC